MELAYACAQKSLQMIYLLQQQCSTLQKMHTWQLNTFRTKQEKRISATAKRERFGKTQNKKF